MGLPGHPHWLQCLGLHYSFSPRTEPGIAIKCPGIRYGLCSAWQVLLLVTHNASCLHIRKLNGPILPGPVDIRVQQFVIIGMVFSSVKEMAKSGPTI